MKIQFVHSYFDVICLENLLLAWQEFIVGKRNKPDVQIFNRNLFDNIIELHEELVNKSYRHGGYESFYINDPKRRHIHKATVKDRLLHHAVYRLLYPFFDKTFIFDSYSCRLGKGTHKAINEFRDLENIVSKNHRRTCWVLKCDIKKFFASVNHKLLIDILMKYIPDEEIIWLLSDIIKSFETDSFSTRGLPLGNLTSQLFANLYLNRLDQWVKHKLKSRYYVRYADDFIFLSENKKWLESIVPEVRGFLEDNLELILHPDKIFIKTVASGVDFLGWINFNDYRILRSKARRRMFGRIQENPNDESLQSYLGLIKHGNTFKLKRSLLNAYWVNKNKRLAT